MPAPPNGLSTSGNAEQNRSYLLGLGLGRVKVRGGVRVAVGVGVRVGARVTVTVGVRVRVGGARVPAVEWWDKALEVTD